MMQMKITLLIITRHQKIDLCKTKIIGRTQDDKNTLDTLEH